MFGQKLSSCKVHYVFIGISPTSEEFQIPCVMTSPTLRKLAVSTHSGDTHQVFIAYDGDIQTTRVTVDKFEFLESLNFLGSNLGLWPGLGLYQLIEGTAALVCSFSLAKIFFKKIKRIFK